MLSNFATSSRDGDREQTLLGFIIRISGRHQIGLALLSILLFTVGTVPIEIQRRIVNLATDRGPYSTIALLACFYGGLVLLEGIFKLLLNVYKSWVGESAIRWLRIAIFDLAKRKSEPNRQLPPQGVQLSIIVAEAEPIGGFVGESFSQPLLQIGVLLTVTGYLVYLQPVMALVMAFVFMPQVGFVPFMQNAINGRVARKTGIMREVSNAIVKAGGANDNDGAQRPRIQSLFAINMGIYKIKFTMNFLMNLMTQLGYVGILSLGGYFVATGKTEVGTLVAFISGLSKINDPWGDLVDWYRSYRVTEVKYDLVLKAMRGEMFDPATVHLESHLLSVIAHE